DDLLAAARAAAVRSGADRVDETGVFGPRVAAMQAVDQAVRTGQPDRAMQLATQVPDTAGTVPGFWESGHRLHLAAACTDLERWAEVAEHLDAARLLAPQWSRVQPLGRTVIGHLIEHRSRRSERIAELAAHYS
ncbi:MAG: transcriptional regulator, partial [Actinomycetota bacterium]|nr:transcriptional regulator [Actinomycetota bacterium]